jgi:hypothetical protein
VSLLLCACRSDTTSVDAPNIPVGWTAPPSGVERPEPAPVPGLDASGNRTIAETYAERARRRREALRGGGSVSSFGGSAPSGWSVSAPKHQGVDFTVTYRQPSSGVVIEQTVLKGARKSALTSYKGMPHRDWVLRDVLVEPADGFQTYWGIRVYEVRDWLLENVEIRGMGAPGREGHAVYANVAGNMTFRNCWFHGNRGQAVQVVARPKIGTAPATGKLEIVDCRFEENGFDSDRAAFAITAFGIGSNHDITIRNTRVTALNLPPTSNSNGTVTNSRGGICIAPVAGSRSEPVWFDEANPPFTQGRVVLDGVYVELKNPAQPLGLFKGCRDAVGGVDTDFSWDPKSGPRVQRAEPAAGAAAGAAAAADESAVEGAAESTAGGGEKSSSGGDAAAAAAGGAVAGAAVASSGDEEVDLSARDALRAPDGFVVDVADWEEIVPTQDWTDYTVKESNATSGVVREQQLIRSARRSGLATYTGVLHEDWTLRDVTVVPAEGVRTLWGMRVYEISDWLLERVEIAYMGVPGDGGRSGREGHAFYGNVAGDLTFDNCWIHHNRGQAIQVVARPRSGTAPAVGKLTVRNSLLQENGFDSDRAAFAVTVHGPGSEYDVELEDVRIEALRLPDHQGHDGRVRNSRGGICIAPVGNLPNEPVWYDAEDPPFTNGRVTLNNVLVAMRRPAQALGLFRGIRELEVTGCAFYGGEGSEVVIDAPGKPGRDCGRVVWKGNQGDATLVYRGRALGPVSGDYELEPPKGDPKGDPEEDSEEAPAEEPTGDEPAEETSEQPAGEAAAAAGASAGATQQPTEPGGSTPDRAQPGPAGAAKETAPEETAGATEQPAPVETPTEAPVTDTPVVPAPDPEPPAAEVDDGPAPPTEPPGAGERPPPFPQPSPVPGSAKDGGA